MTIQPRQIETWASNKTAHPGNILKSAVPRRTSAEVQKAREAKAKAKADREEAKQQSIVRVAEFEHADMVNEDMVDATPRPPFTPKPWPPPRSRKNTNLVPIAESSDVNTGNALNEASASSEWTVTEDDSATESHDPPCAKKRKAQATEASENTKPVGGKAGKGKKKANMDDEIVPTSDEEETPKPKKVKVKVRDEINVATKKMVENAEVKGDKYGDMMKSMSSKQAEEQQPAPKFTPQLQAAGGMKKKLKREGAAADISMLNEKPDSWDDSINDLMDIDDASNVDESRQKRKHLSAIAEWASAIPKNKTSLKSTSQASKLTTSSRAKSNIPSLTAGASSRSSAPSVLSDQVKIISRRSSDLIKVKDEPTSNAPYYNGGLSDNDEMRGEEREVAINSPPKGKKRISSEQLVIRKSSKTDETAPKKLRHEELPAWVEVQWFRHTFVTTYMAFVGQTADPWDVPAKQSVKVMQKIWDATSGYDYEITTSTAIYQKTVQRLADSWRNVIGSNGIMVLMAFFDSQPGLRDSDSNRMEFAKYYLEDLRFLYKDSEHENKKNWKGLFRSPFILQTFAAHLAAIEGSVKVPGLHDDDKPTPAMVGGLGLTAASVERALTLVATGTLTIPLARASKGKTIPLPRTVNLSTGKGSVRQTGFSDVAWGKATRSYATSVRLLTNTKFDAIVRDAQEFMKPIRARNRATDSADVIVIDDDDDERAHLVDNSDDSESDSECMALFQPSLPQP